MITVSKVRKILSQIKETSSSTDIVSSKTVQQITIAGNDITVTLRPQPEKATNDTLVQSVTAALKTLPEAGEVKILLAGRSAAAGPDLPANPLSGIKNIIAVSSCKGGVGKSTIAAHLAVELSRRGFKTGLLDADLHGPSIPMLFNLPKVPIYSNEAKQILPVEHGKLKLMSFGFLLGDEPAVMRGPIVTRYIHQILLQTAWGDLDYLLIDFPPGTSDIHITITQSVRLTGAVIVTTPHTLSLLDVTRGILMFEQVSVPILGIIENMAYFQPPGSKEKHFLFGESSQKILEERFGVTTLNQIPILPALGQTIHEPLANSYIQTSVDHLLEVLDKRKDLRRQIPHIECDQTEIRLFWDNGETWSVGNFDLRINSRDALSIDEITGEPKIKPQDIRPDIAAVKIIPLGNYAINVTWNDGHSAGIYPYKLIEELAKKNVVSN